MDEDKKLTGYPSIDKPWLKYQEGVFSNGNGWIACGAIICQGVTIGDNSIIGAGSVVTKDIPPNVLAMGTPCKVVREITEDDRIPEELLKEFCQ